jgi:hypothetical protein
LALASLFSFAFLSASCCVFSRFTIPYSVYTTLGPCGLLRDDHRTGPWYVLSASTPPQALNSASHLRLTMTSTSDEQRRGGVSSVEAAAVPGTYIRTIYYTCT